MAFDPRRDVTVNSGAFRVDVDELCAAHTLISGEETLAIVPARLALDAALGEADAVSGLIPEASARLASAITAALSALNSLETEIDSLRWKLQDTALTYANAENGSSLWERGASARWSWGPPASRSPEPRRSYTARKTPPRASVRLGSPPSSCPVSHR